MSLSACESHLDRLHEQEIEMQDRLEIEIETLRTMFHEKSERRIDDFDGMQLDQLVRGGYIAHGMPYKFVAGPKL